MPKTKKHAVLIAMMPGRADFDFSFLLQERGRDERFYKNDAIAGKLKFDGRDSGDMIYIVNETLNDDSGVSVVIVSPYYMRFEFSRARDHNRVVDQLCEIMDASGVYVNIDDEVFKSK